MLMMHGQTNIKSSEMYLNEGVVLDVSTKFTFGRWYLVFNL